MNVLCIKTFQSLGNVKYHLYPISHSILLGGYLLSRWNVDMRIFHVPTETAPSDENFMGKEWKRVNITNSESAALLSFFLLLFFFFFCIILRR